MVGRVVSGRGLRWAIPLLWGVTGRARSSFSVTGGGCGGSCRPGWPGSRLQRGVSFSPWPVRWRRGSPWRWAVGVPPGRVTLPWCGRVSCGSWGRGTCRGWPVGSQPLVGFTGSRSLSPRFSGLVGAVVQSVVQSGRGVAVGDAAGADAFVRVRARQCGCTPRVFRPQRQQRVSYRPFVQSPVTGRFVRAPHPVSRLAGPRFGAALAQRSAAMVRAVQQGGGGAGVVGFVASPCPVHPRSGQRLAPSRSSVRCFGGFGSGTWSTLAFAVALGLPVVVFALGVPSTPGVSPWAALPSHWGGIWVSTGVGGPWVKARRFVPLQRAQVGVPFPQPWAQ